MNYELHPVPAWDDGCREVPGDRSGLAMLGTVWENEVRTATAPSGEETSSVTGLHLLYPGLLVFYVEGGEDDLNDFLRLLNNLTAKEALGLTKVKVVHMIHNIKGHMLSSWHWKVVDPPIRSERMDHRENKVKLIKMVLHIVLNLSKQPPLTVKKTLENLQEKMIRFIPNAAMLESILRDTSLLDPYQYIQQVLNLRGVTLDSELVWPVPYIMFSVN
jgi:hypothetical protein